MRMEHKSPLLDIEFNPSPRAFESKERFDSQTKPLFEVASNQSQQQQQHGHIDHHDQPHGCKTFENITYTTFNATAPIEPHTFVQEKPFERSYIEQEPPPPTATTTPVKYSSVSQRVKTLEQCDQEPNLYKSAPVWNASKESPIFSTPSTATYQSNGVCTPNPVNETLEKISNKMQEYEQTHWSGYDLKAPALVKHVTPSARPFTNGYESKNTAISQPLPNLEPGETPEFCFAPRFTSERKPSLVERIEKSLERELEKGPSKVLPYSVRTMPPSPQTVSTEAFESTKRTIVKQAKQPEPTTEHHLHKELNHIKNTFYENNKPLQRKTIDHIPTSSIQTLAPKKVRIVVFLFRVQILNVLKSSNQSQINLLLKNNNVRICPSGCISTHIRTVLDLF